ncbi:arginase family protein, partial [Mesorhizobium sp. M2D.F.Ca.ET.232.01.1.1]|uniref:arginase family protein n=1 Tax=Mesorhizobium sp. M2D.F.Ca.ET.232.01.1.1 TaxID=2496670 RepID=UPI0032AF6FE2
MRKRDFGCRLRPSPSPHPDIYHSYGDNLRSHTSPFARIMEERLADRLIQIGLRTVNDHHRE